MAGYPAQLYSIEVLLNALIRIKVHVKLQRGKSTATEPLAVEVSDYSSLSSDNDYTDTDSDTNKHFLFKNVRYLQLMYITSGIYNLCT